MAILASIEVEDDGSLKIRNFRDALTELGAAGEEAAKGVGAVAPASQTSGNALQSLHAQTAAAALAFGALAFGAVSMVKEAADLAGRVQVLNTSITAVAKSSKVTSWELQVAAQAIQKLGITAREADNAVIQFTVSNLKLADAVKLSRVAQDLAVVAGLNSSQTFGLLVSSIEQLNPRALRMAGIITTLDKIYEKFTKTTGVAAKDMTTLQQKQAVVNEILEQGKLRAGAYEAAMSDASKQIGSFARVTENAKVALGEAFLPVMLMAIEGMTKLIETFTNADPEVKRVVSSLLAAVAAMAAISAAIATSHLLQLPNLIKMIMTPMGAWIIGLGLVAGAIVYLTSKSKIMTEEMIQSAAETQATKDKFDSLLKVYNSMPPAALRSAEAQAEFNRTAISLSKLAPDAIEGIDSITGAFNLNTESLARNRKELDAVMAAQLASAEAEFQKRIVKEKDARDRVTAAHEAQVVVLRKVKEAGLDLNKVQELAARNTIQTQLAGLGHNDVLAITAMLYRDSTKELAASSAAHIIENSALEKERVLREQLNPVIQEQMRLAKLDADAAAAAADVKAAADTAAKAKAVELAKYRAEERKQIEGLGEKDKIRFQEMNAALAKAGEGTKRYNDLLIMNKSIIAEATAAQGESLKGLNALTAGVEDLKRAGLVLEMEEWSKKATKLAEDLALAAKDIVKGFTEDASKLLVDYSEKIKDTTEKHNRSIAELDEDLHTRLTASKQTELQKALAANNKYYNDLKKHNNLAIIELQKLKEEEIKKIDELAVKRKKEIDDLIANAHLRFKIEFEVIDKIDKLRKALDSGEDAETAKKRITADFIKNTNAMAAAEKKRIDDVLAATKAAAREQHKIIDATIAKYEDQNKRITSQNAVTNAEIVKNHSSTYQMITSIIQNASQTAVNSIMGILDGTKSFKQAFLDIFNSIKDTMASIVDGIVKKWVSSLLGIGPKLKGGGADDFVGPIEPGQSGGAGGALGGGKIGMKGAGAMGVMAGAGAAMSGGSAKSQFAQVGLAAAGVTASAAMATGATVAGTVALGAATLGIGAAVVGVALLIKHFTSVTKEVKEARKQMGEFREALHATLTVSQKLEAGNEEWKKDLIAIRDAYVATGRTAAQAEEITRKLWDTDHPENMRAAMEEINGVLEEAAGIWQGVQDSAAALTKFIEGGIDTQGKYNITASSAVAIFNAWVKETGDVLGALEQIGPALDELAKSSGELGFEGSAAVESLLGLRKVVEENQVLMDSISSTTNLLVALGSAGLLTGQTITDFGQAAFNQFTMLSAATGDANQAMILMQPSLQALWEAEQKFGKSADESTRSLIDQAEKQGIVGANMRDVNEKLLSVLLAIANVLGADIPAGLDDLSGGLSDVGGDLADSEADFERWRNEAVDAARDVESAIDGVSVGHSPGGIKDIAIQLGLAERAMRNFSRTTVQEAGSAEGAINNLRMPTRVAVPSESALPATGTEGVGGSGIIININPKVEIFTPDPSTMDDMMERQVGPKLVRMIENNVDQIAVDIQKAMAKYTPRT